jgi:tRNA pseudouridine55 synthase
VSRRSRRERRDGPHGVLLLDKPRGPTSHDMVVLARQALGTRAVGHAGTLDPMATGLLVLAVGEATKLVRYLASEDKEYIATIALGRTTDSLDADGRVTERLPVPPNLTPSLVESALQRFLGTIEQKPPSVSAVKSGGLPLHKRVRRGELVDPPARRVELREVHLLELRRDEMDIRLHCGKGFYVRALARDLTRALGTVGHLTALRRLRSGSFGLEGASDAVLLQGVIAGDDERSRLLATLLPPAECCGDMPRLMLDERGCENAFHGRPIPFSQLLSAPPVRALQPENLVALLDADADLVAIGRVGRDGLQVERGFRYL